MSATSSSRQAADNFDEAGYHRRLRAAGIDPDGPAPENIDEARCQLARRICMMLNEWHGCPQPVCQRQRGCMAPEGRCSNVSYPEEVHDAEWIQAKTDIRLALDRRLREVGVLDEEGRYIEDE